MGQSSQPVKKTDGKQLATKQKKLHSTSVKVEKWKVEEPIEEKGIVPHPSAGASQSLFLRAMQMKEKDVLSEKDEKDGFENRFSKKPRETTPLSDVPQRRSQELIRSKPQTAISKSNSPSIQPTPVVEELISAIKVEKKKNDAENMLRNLYKMAAVGKVSPNSQQLLSAMGQSSKPEKMTDTIGYQAHQNLPTIQQILEHIADQTAIPVPIPELPKDLFSKSKQKNKIDRYVDEDQKRVNKVNNSAKFNESTLQNEVRPQNDVPHRRSQEPIRSKPQTTISKRETPSIQPTPVVEELISAIKVEKKKNDAEAMLRNMYKMAAMGKVSPDSQPFFSAMGQTSQPVKKTYGKKLATEQKKLHSTSVKVEEPTKEKGIVPHPSAGASDSLFLRAMQMKEKDIVSGKDEKSGFENRFSRKPKETTPQNDVPHRRSQEPIRSKPQTTISKRETPSIQPTPVVEELISAIKVEKKKNDAENMLRNLYKMAAVGKVSPDSQQLLSAMGQSSKPEKMTDTIGYRAHQDLPTIQQILEHIADQTAIPVPIPELPKDLFSKSKQKNKIDRYVNEDQKRVNKVNNSAKFDESNLQNEVRPQHDVPHRRSQEPIRSKPQTTISKRETPSIQPTPVVEELISAIKVEKKKNDAEAMLRNMYKMAAMGKVSPDSQPFFSAMGQSSQPVKKTYGKKLATEQKKLHSTSVKVEESTKEKGIVPHPSAGASDSLNRRAMQMKEKDIVSGKDEKGGFENRFSKKPKATTPLNYVPQKRYQEPIRSETQPPISKSKTPSIQATPVVEELISEIKVVKKKNDAEDTLRKLYKMAAIGKDSRDGQQLFSAMGQHSKMLNTSNQADDETEMSFHEKDPELGNDYSESPFSRTLRTKRDHAAATKSDSTRKQGRGVIADATTSSKYAGEDVRIRSASSFENEDEPPHSQTCRDPVPRTWNQQVNASPIADGQNQNRMESPAFHIDTPIAHYSQPPPARPRKANVSNVPDVDDEVLTEHHASLQQRSAPRDVYDEQDSPASKMLARSKKKISRSLDDILESNSEDPGANAEKQRKQSDEPEDVNRWVDSTVERSEVGPAGHILAKGSNLPQAGKLSRSVPVLSPSDEEAESPDSWSESSQMSEKMPKRFGQAFSTSSAGSISSSMMSLYSEAGDFGKLPITGEVEFSLRYNERGNELLVHVSRCRDLAPANEKKKRSDAYVKTYLLPDRSRQSKRKTVIKKKTLSPKYDEVLKYKIEKSDLANRILNLSVWHNDMFGRNVFLGEVNLILNSWDWTNQTLNWYSLQPKDFTIMEPIVSRGQLTLGLKYVPAKSLDGKKPASGEIHIWIQNAYNLVPVRSQGVDSFVKCYILPDTSRQSRQKTRVVRKNCNPEYNHTMVYDGFQAEDLNEACIELTIWDYERFSTNQFLGGVRLSFGKGTSYGKAVDWMDSQGEEIRLYKKLLETPNEWNQGILPLRPQMATAENPSK